jgi:hypothetical protein
MRRFVNEQVSTSSGTIAMVQKQARVEKVILGYVVHNLDFNLSKKETQIQHCLLEQDQLLQPTDPMDLDLPDTELPEYMYYIQDTIAKGQIVIVPPVQDKTPGVRADSAFTEELFPLPIRPPPPSQQQQIKKPPADPAQQDGAL